MRVRDLAFAVYQRGWSLAIGDDLSYTFSELFVYHVEETNIAYRSLSSLILASGHDLSKFLSLMMVLRIRYMHSWFSK